MHARLAGVIKGAETVNHYKRREAVNDGRKPAFGDTARSVGKEFVDDAPKTVKMKARLREVYHQRGVEEGLKGEPEDWVRVR